MRGGLRGAVLAVAACVLLSFAPTPGAAETGGARYVQVVAHPDDDILFMNPDLRTAVRSGAPVTTVYLTAGESDVRPAEPYAAGRQAGSRAAFAAMAAVPDEWERTAIELLPGRFAEVHVLRARPAIRLVFLNLPDDNDPLAVGGKHALSRLWTDGGSVRTVVPAGATLPGPSEYGRERLISALAELLRRYDPTVLRTQDPLPDPRYQAHWDAHDHPDHVATTRFATAAAARHDGPVRVVHYRGYNVADAAPNLSPDVVETKRRTFARYAPHDPLVGLGEPYGTWLRSMRYRWPASAHQVERDGLGRLHFADVRRGRLLLGERAGSRIEPVPLPAPPVGPGDVAFAPDGDGLRVVVRDFRSGASYSTSQDSDGRWRPRWRTVAPPGDGAALGRAAITSTVDGRMVVARTDARSGVHARIGDGPWIRLHAEDVGDVAVVRGRGGIVHVFAATPDGMAHWESAGDDFAPAQVPLGLRPAGPIEATAAPDGTALLAFRQAEDGVVVVLAESDEPGGGWRVRARLRSSGGGSGPALAAPSPTNLVLAVRTGLGGTEVFSLSPRGVRRTVLGGAVADRPSLSADGTLAATADDGALLVSEPGADGGYRQWERLAAPGPAGRPGRGERTSRNGATGDRRLRGRLRLGNTAQCGPAVSENTNINVKDARSTVNAGAGRGRASAGSAQCDEAHLGVLAHRLHERRIELPGQQHVVEVGDRGEPVQRGAADLARIHQQHPRAGAADHRPLHQHDLLFLVEGHLGVHRRGGQEHQVHRQPADHLLAGQSDERVVRAGVLAADADQPDVRSLPQRLVHLSVIADHGQRADIGQQAGQGERRRRVVQQHRHARSDQGQRGGGQRFLLLGVGVQAEVRAALEHGGGLRGDAAVELAQQSAADQVVDVAVHRHQADPGQRGQLRGAGEAALDDVVDDLLLAQEPGGLLLGCGRHGRHLASLLHWTVGPAESRPSIIDVVTFNYPGVNLSAVAERVGGTPMTQPDRAPGAHRAVVFDMDGVLVDSEHLWERMWARFAAARGQTWTAEQTRQVQGMSAPEWSAFLARFSLAEEPASETERIVVDDMIAALEAGEIELLPGAERMVLEVSDRVVIGLASSAPRRLIDAVLDLHALSDCFSATVSSAEVPRGKPSPDVYLAAANKLGRHPRECLAVEDSSNGLRSAAAAEMTVVAIPSADYPPAEDALTGASFVAADLDEVRVRLLESLTTPVAG